MGEPGKAAARKAAEKIQAKLVLGDLSILDPPKPVEPVQSVPTLRKVAAGWELVKAPDLKRGTQISYANAIRKHLNDAFGDLPITAITEDCVEAWWMQFRHAGYSKKHVGTARQILRGICRRACSLKLLTVNPVDRFEGRLGKVQGAIRKKSDWLTAEDFETFLQTADRICQRGCPIVLFMATCGLRIGEAVGLQVGDLDVADCQLHIRRTVRRGYIDSPKNGEAGIGDVPPTTMVVLERIKEIRRVEAAAQGTEPRWLFPSQFRKDAPITPENVSVFMRRVLAAAGLRKIRPHDLRNTYATLAIKAGVNILSVSRQLRHSSIAITADVYTHAVPGGNRAAANVTDAILTGHPRNQAQPPRNQLRDLTA